jgi:predicted kinase
MALLADISGPMFIVFGGLPGTGKTTIASLLARELGALYLRVDVIEQAIRDAGVVLGDLGPVGYMVGYGLAEANLRLGHIVVADSVNPLAITRAAWRKPAADALAPVVEVEVVCSDIAEHRRRVTTRQADIAGFTLPDWAAVTARHYEPWPQPHLIIDTARCAPAEAVGRILEACAAQGVPLRPYLR